MAKNKTTAELGKFKEEIHSALYKNADICNLLLGDEITDSPSKKRELFKEHVKSHLFIDDTIQEAGSYIFYDVVAPTIHSNIKNCYVYMYLICHRDILDNYSRDGYFGNRADILCQMVEDALINDPEVANSFGIGELTLDSIDIYNATRFYGRYVRFGVPNFR